MHKTIYKKVHFKMKTRTSFDILNAPGVWCYETNIPDDSHISLLSHCILYQVSAGLFWVQMGLAIKLFSCHLQKHNYICLAFL